MLCIYRSFRELPFSALMKIYEETNLKTGNEHWPHEPIPRQLALAEDDFCQYLRQTYYRSPGASYFIWWDAGEAVSAFRFEAYRDGLLVTALETAPKARGKGYAGRLLREVMQEFRGTEQTFYAHIHKRNTPSVRIHEGCGFCKLHDGATLLDGTFTTEIATYCLKIT